MNCNPNQPKSHPDPFVTWLRNASPYIHAHRDRTCVISFGGEAVLDPNFHSLIHDIALLHGLGMRLVIVHGTRPQIETRLLEKGATLHYVQGLRVTDATALTCVKEAAGVVRIELEALLSMGLGNSPMAGVRIRVASGNFVTARPLGVRDGVDYGHTGLVRRIDADGIKQRLDAGAIVIISPLGYSPTGEVFNLSAQDLAAACAVALQADKLIDILEYPLPQDAQGLPLNILPLTEVAGLLANHTLSDGLAAHIQAGVSACRGGVTRVHLLNRQMDGELLRELFTRDGVGTLLTAGIYETTRTAQIDDVVGIVELLQPLEEQGILVRRSRELLETEIEHFTVMERDGTVIACAALYPYLGDNMAELAGLAVHPEYRRGKLGAELLVHLERQALKLGISRLFVLTTQTAHWFLEQGFVEVRLDSLPMAKQVLYNYKRNSKVFMKDLTSS